jgi:hypothetical protein
MSKEVHMRPFDVDGTKYISINGKSFFLLRAYAIRYDKFVFVQVFGRSALTKDDLPEKNWEIVMTKGAEGKVYTAWKPSFFDGSNETRLFVGATADASLRLLLAHHAPNADVTRVLSVAYETGTFSKGHVRYQSGIVTFEDKGNAGVPAFALGRSGQFEYWINHLPEEACQTH